MAALATRHRLTLLEYGEPTDTPGELAILTGMDRIRATSLLLEAGSRIAGQLGLKSNPVELVGMRVRIVGVAGLIKLAPGIDLEVIPKLLSEKDDESPWREDFFFIATLTRFGRLLDADRIASSSAAAKDLPTLIARALVRMYADVRRRPLRTYRRQTVIDFYLEDEVDPVDLIYPDPDGFRQELIRFDRVNYWNSAILAAAQLLQSEISDPGLAVSLGRIVAELRPQSAFHAGAQRRIPARHRAWETLFQLSLYLLQGRGLKYTPGPMKAPGYVFSTWQTWEDFLAVNMRLAYGPAAVRVQHSFLLGRRQRLEISGKSSALSVYPDCCVLGIDDSVAALVDAKYKVGANGRAPRVNEADIYEALAFSKASGCPVAVLIYPYSSSGEEKVGAWKAFERVQVGSIAITAIQVSAQGISSQGGLQLFTAGLKSAVESCFIRQ